MPRINGVYVLPEGVAAAPAKRLRVAFLDIAEELNQIAGETPSFPLPLTTNNYLRASGANSLQQRTPAQVRSDIGANNAANLNTGTLPNARLSADVYQRANILGTVSQSSGVPTGAVIERGSNANGEFVRFADGTQICTTVNTTGLATTVAQGALYRSASVEWTFPASFITPPAVSAQAESFQRWCAFSAATTSSVLIRQFSPIDSSATNNTIASATGRWY